MLWLIRAACALALLVSPLSVGADSGEEGAAQELDLEGSAVASEMGAEEGGLSPRLRKRTRKKWDPQTYEVREPPPSTEKPELQLELDSPGAGFAVIPPATESRRRGLDARGRAGIGMGVSVLAFAAGLGMAAAAASQSICISLGEPCSRPSWVAPVVVSGALLVVGGIIGIGVSASQLRKHPPDRYSSRVGRHAKRRGIGWDLASSQLVF